MTPPLQVADEPPPVAVTVTYEAPHGCPDQRGFELQVIERTTGRRLETKEPSGPRRVNVRIRVQGGRASAEATLRDAEGVSTTRHIEAATCEEAVEGLALVIALTLDPRDRSAAPSRAPEAPPRSTTGASTPGASHHAGLSTSLLAATGLAPEALPVVEFGASASSDFGSSIEVSVRAALRLARHGEERTPEGNASFEWGAVATALCAGERRGSGGFTLAGCLAGEYGRLHASGSETRSPRSAARPWAALGPAVMGEWAVLAPLTLQAGVEALFPLSHDRFLVGSRVAHEVPALSLRAGLGVGVLLP